MRSKFAYNLLNNISPERQLEIDTDIEKMTKHNEWMASNGYVYNTDTSPSLLIIREHGFHPIAITCMMCEETFLFETDEESHAAYNRLEVELNLVSGWWYSSSDWADAFESHCNAIYDGDRSLAAPIYWFK